VVERIFGVLKKCFKVLVSTPEYGLEFQAKLIQALLSVHNFIRIYDPTNKPVVDDKNGAEGYGMRGLGDGLGDLHYQVSSREDKGSKEMR
jgi:hypothetical protein